MNPPKILALDIGNSRTKLAIFINHTMEKSDFLPSQPEYAEKICLITDKWYQDYAFQEIIISSVVPAQSDMLQTMMSERYHQKIIMVEDIKTQLLPLKVDRPETVGVDRVVNSYAAIQLCGTPCIVISLGTATTFEVISTYGEYLGGAICPGVRISMEALTQRTALLPPPVWKKPKSIIAKNTMAHMESGIYYGTLSLIEGMVQRMKPEVGKNTKIVCTGGLSTILAQENIFDYHEPHLTLKGLERIHRHHFQSR